MHKFNKRQRDRGTSLANQHQIQSALDLVGPSIPLILQCQIAGMTPHQTAGKLNGAKLEWRPGVAWDRTRVVRTLERCRFMDRLNAREARRSPPVARTCDRCSEPTGIVRSPDKYDASTLVDYRQIDLCSSCANGPLECPECGERLNYIGRSRGTDTWTCSECGQPWSAPSVGTSTVQCMVDDSIPPRFQS